MLTKRKSRSFRLADVRIRANAVPLAEEHVARRAALLEQLVTPIGSTGRGPQIVRDAADVGELLFVRPRANISPAAADAPVEFGIVEQRHPTQLVRLHVGRGDRTAVDLFQQGPRPYGPPEQKASRRRAQREAHVGIRGKHGLGDLRLIEPRERRQSGHSQLVVGRMLHDAQNPRDTIGLPELGQHSQ